MTEKSVGNIEDLRGHKEKGARLRTISKKKTTLPFQNNEASNGFGLGSNNFINPVFLPKQRFDEQVVLSTFHLDIHIDFNATVRNYLQAV